MPMAAKVYGEMCVSALVQDISAVPSCSLPARSLLGS
jgi:hypothetical protein